MENTLDPQVIYDSFSRREMSVSRIDHFDRGDYAEIRINLNIDSFLSPTQLLKLATRLKVIEDREKLHIEIVHIDMRHKTMRLNISTRKGDEAPVEDDSTGTFPIGEITR